jgi:hypothetical protein
VSAPKHRFHRRDAKNTENHPMKNISLPLRTLRLCGEFIRLWLDTDQVRIIVNSHGRYGRLL